MSFGQILLFTIFAGIKKVDQKGPQVVIHNSMFWGMVVGLCMGDLKTGLFIGGTYQLMSLGVAALGGSSVPDYQIGTIITTAIAISSGVGIEAGMAIGLPICMLSVQFDVVGNIVHGQLVQQAKKCCHARNFKGMNLWIWSCVIVTALTTMIPTFLGLALGTALVEHILAIVPAWFTAGLSLAGKILPLCGLAVLMGYMPVKKYFEYILFGFVMYAYLGVPVLGIAIVAVGLAWLLYKNLAKEPLAAVAAGNGDVIGGDEDE